MVDQNVIGDVRDAKTWWDGQCPSFSALGARLAAIETAYRNRTDEFAGVPREQPPEVRAMIAKAEDEPGRALLNDTRSTRPL